MSVVKLSDKVKNPKFSSVKDMLTMIGAKEASGNFGKNPAVLVLIHDRDTDDYRTFYESAGLSASQAISLLEVVKHRIMTERMKEPT